VSDAEALCEARLDHLFHGAIFACAVARRKMIV
jgi:hypothetical protein